MDASSYLSTMLTLNRGKWKLVHQEILVFLKQVENNQALPEGVTQRQA